MTEPTPEEIQRAFSRNKQKDHYTRWDHLKYNVRFLITGPNEDDRVIQSLFGFDEPYGRRQHVKILFWAWRNTAWHKFLRHTVCRLRGHEFREIEPCEAMWYGGQVCDRCGKVNHYNEDGTIWKPPNGVGRA